MASVSRSGYLKSTYTYYPHAARTPFMAFASVMRSRGRTYRSGVMVIRANAVPDAGLKMRKLGEGHTIPSTVGLGEQLWAAYSIAIDRSSRPPQGTRHATHAIYGTS